MRIIPHPENISYKHWKIIKEILETSHLERDALTTLMKTIFQGKEPKRTVRELTQNCAFCAINEPS